MKILYYDCFSGISGDMNLGALVDVGVPEEFIITELKKLKLEGFELEFTKSLKMGISGTKANVKLTGVYSHKNNHNHKPEEIRHKHTDKEKHKHHDTNGEHMHRNLNDIRKIIENSDLNAFVKGKSLQVFEEIAVAEAKIHSKEINEIHFHEVGAIDSIVDIVGAAICIDFIKPEKIICSTIELGGGFVTCAHGIFPVPAPATAEILKGIPVKKGTVNQETTTPTGAAILKVFADEFSDNLDFSIERIGYGIGHRDLDIPNVLRIFSGGILSSDIERTPALLIESNIDDMNPENYEYIIDKLFEAGAQDVFLVPIIMKKSRPATKLTVLCDHSTRNIIEHIILTESTSLGLRCIPVIKSMLERKTRTIDTAYGLIRIKEAYYNDIPIKYKAEYDDCILAAHKNKVGLKEVYAEVDRIVEQLKNKS